MGPPALPPEVLAEVARRVPGVRWERVRFHGGLPRLARLHPRAHAMALPCAWHPSRVHVHLGAHDPRTPEGFEVLVHEAVHVRQYQDMGPGLGGWRPFVVAYLGWVPWRGTGRRHPLERSAYAQDASARTRFWRALAGEAPVERRGLALRLAVGMLGGALAFALAPLVEPSALRARAAGPPRP